MGVRHFTIKDVSKWYQRTNRRIFLGDVLDPSNSDAMSVGFARYEKKVEKNEWVVTYDEALIVTRGPTPFTPRRGQRRRRWVRSSS